MSSSSLCLLQVFRIQSAINRLTPVAVRKACASALRMSSIATEQAAGMFQKLRIYGFDKLQNGSIFS